MIRSALFAQQMYVAMGVPGLVFLPAALVLSDGAMRACRIYCRWVRWTAHRMLGLRMEIHGAPPVSDVLIAAKHQSFLDVILIFASLPRPRFGMRAGLMRRLAVWAASPSSPVEKERQCANCCMLSIAGGRW